MNSRSTESGRPGDLDLIGTNAIVVGASRGLGRGITTALAATGAHVIGVARHRAGFADLESELGARLSAVVGDATDADLAAALIAEHRPRTIVVNAGAVPVMAALQDLDWDAFSQPWNVDVKASFVWATAALRAPLAAGSTVVLVSSGAALGGLPLSGGYAGAKATVRFVSTYAAGQSAQRDLGIRFATIIPMLTPLSAVGAAGAAAYGAHDAGYLDGFKPFLTPEVLGSTIVDLVRTTTDSLAPETLVTGRGGRPLPTAGQ